MTEAGAALLTLKAGSREIRLQYMTPADASALLAFARSFPQHDLLFLPTDITSVEGVNEWVNGVLTGQVGVILAFEGDQVVGYASVIRHAPLWMRHVAEIGVLVHETLRRHGVGSALTNQAFAIASDLGVSRMLAQMTLDQQPAIQLFRRLGFSPLAILPQHVTDQDGTTFDLLMMHQDVARFGRT